MAFTVVTTKIQIIQSVVFIRLFSEIFHVFLFLLLRAIYTNYFEVASSSNYSESLFLNGNDEFKFLYTFEISYAMFQYFCYLLVFFSQWLFPFFLLRNVCLTFTEIPDTKPEMPDARLAIQ